MTDKKQIDGTVKIEGISGIGGGDGPTGIPAYSNGSVVITSAGSIFYPKPGTGGSRENTVGSGSGSYGSVERYIELTDISKKEISMHDFDSLKARVKMIEEDLIILRHRLERSNTFIFWIMFSWASAALIQFFMRWFNAG